MSILLGLLSGIWPYIIAIGGLVGGGLAIAFRLINAGKTEEKVKQQEQQIQDEIAVDKRVTDALNNDSSVRTDVANGGLRDDDGHKRTK